MEHSCDKKATTTTLICSPPVSAVIPSFGTTEEPLTIAPFNVAALSIDTSKYRNPCIKLEVSFTANPIALVALRLQIVRQCKTQLPVIVGGTWTYSAATGSNTVTFFACDKDFCNQDCCTYYLQIFNDTIIAGPLILSNITLSALVVDPCCC